MPPDGIIRSPFWTALFKTPSLRWDGDQSAFQKCMRISILSHPPLAGFSTSSSRIKGENQALPTCYRRKGAYNHKSLTFSICKKPDIFDLR
jgi:hypothetical protein